MFVDRLVCSRCGAVYQYSDSPLMCRRNDFGRLDIIYDYDAARESFSRQAVSRRVWGGVWRYWELLPVEGKYAASLMEGGTPLLKTKKLGEHLGFKSFFVKDETRNPTASFKDRAMAVGAAKAVETGRRDVVIASSGNAASSLAAYSASLGLRCHAFVPEDVSTGKASQLLLYGAKVFRVKQTVEGRDPTVDLMVQTVSSWGWYPCPSFGPFNPYQVEGPKTIVYEVLEQLGWSVPDALLIPTGSGCLAAGIWKGLRDLMQLGLIDSYPSIVPVQPAGNQPLASAIKQGKAFSDIQPEKNPRSIASGLLDPYPWDGDAVIEGVKATHGCAETVEEDEIRESVRLLARMEGVFAEPSGAVGVLAAKKLLEAGWLDKSDTVVVLATGSGLKEPEKVVSGEKIPLTMPDLESLLRFL
ncbi:MAG: threonine synthase [Candidatus Caldarchaeum sp.]|nr:threonine synthase [Candidatus Caldarchaeum sp.]